VPGCPKFGASLAPRNIFSHYSHAYTQQHVDALAALTSAGLAERRAGFSPGQAPASAAAAPRAPRPKKDKAESAEAEDDAQGEESTSREATEAEEQAPP
jgi:hypothetical protein